MNSLSKKLGPAPDQATWHDIDEDNAQQRIDNFLLRVLRDVPKSHVYRLLRTGQVRVNSRRVEATYRLLAGDRLRLPPVRITPAPRKAASTSSSQAAFQLATRIVLEDDHLLVLDKPAGMAAHGGSGISHGVIEQLRQERPHARFLELVHRLDRDTSGVLLLAKKRSALVDLHEQIRLGEMQKRYLVLVCGHWRDDKRSVRLPLTRYVAASGERRVSVDANGAAALTIFTLRQRWRDFALLEADLRTGRTHQIRVHLAHLRFPIAGDDKYGDFALNKTLPKRGLRRMFLHAFSVGFRHPGSREPISVEVPLPTELKNFLATLSVPGTAADKT